MTLTAEEAGAIARRLEDELVYTSSIEDLWKLIDTIVELQPRRTINDIRREAGLMPAQ